MFNIKKCLYLLFLLLFFNGQSFALSRNQLWDLCYNKNNQEACDAWDKSIHEAMDKVLAPIDDPKLRKLTNLCYKGNVRACEAETAWRRSITGGYQNAINTMNGIYGSDWERSFGIGGQ